VPVSCNRSGSGPNSVYQGFIQVMTGYSRLEEYELIPITEIEPIRLNAARQVRDFLGEKEAIRSLVVVSPGFTSRRSFLVYREVFKGTGVEVSCLPVFGQRNTSNWTGSWHGIQEVFLELGKLWYYRLAVL